MSSSEIMPPAADLLESMRAVGYSADTAVADLIDNSIAAKAKSVTIGFETVGEPYLSILDDGLGMNKEELRVAMRLAGKPPSAPRSKYDLGRFGLGLKTASFSQAKRLTVVSKSNGSETFAAVWDLDEVQASNTWKLLWLSEEEISKLPDISGLDSLKAGTLVIWEKLDLLLADSQNDPAALTGILARVSEHLALVFHRFLDGGPSDRMSIFVNDKRLQAIDPFFTKNPGTQIKPETRINLSGSEISVTPYILPHLSKLTREERSESEFLKQRFRETQGFYIYREKRLISFGSWFRLAPRSELSKLARVKVDTPNTLDTVWKLGVMKSSVQPPDELKRKLAHLVPNIINESKRVVTRKGAVTPNIDSLNAWNFREIGKHKFNLEIDRNHPLIQALDQTATEQQRRIIASLLYQLETGLPVIELAQRINGDNVHAGEVQSKDDLLKLALSLYESIRPLYQEDLLTIKAILRMEPFLSDPFKQELVKENLASIIKNQEF